MLVYFWRLNIFTYEVFINEMELFMFMHHVISAIKKQIGFNKLVSFIWEKSFLIFGVPRNGLSFYCQDGLDNRKLALLLQK